MLLMHPAIAAATTARALYEDVYAAFAVAMETCGTMPGATELVAAAARAGLRLAIVTSSTRASLVHKRVNHEALFAAMGAIVTVEDVEPRPKPFPDAYLRGAQLLGVDIARCIVVEDSLPGVRAGVAAGGTVVAVPRARLRADVHAAGASYTLTSLFEFPLAALGMGDAATLAEALSNEGGARGGAAATGEGSV